MRTYRYQEDDDDGNVIRDQDGNVVRVRVPMMFMDERDAFQDVIRDALDENDPVKRAVAATEAVLRAEGGTITDANGERGLGLHQPGLRYASDAVSLRARQKANAAYEKYEEELVNAWRPK